VLLALLLRVFRDTIRGMGNTREIDGRFGRSVSECLIVEDLRAMRIGWRSFDWEESAEEEELFTTRSLQQR
jgi:hypothetical protein